MSRETAVQRIRRWRFDPVAFVREVFGAEPDAWQADTLVAAVSNPRVAMVACKGPGKSCVIAWLVWWFVATHLDAQVLAMSITRPNLKDNLWKEMAYWHTKSDLLQATFEVAGERIFSKERPKTWWVSARSFSAQADKSQQANTLAGLHADHVMIVLDEVSDYPDGVVSAAEGIFAGDVDAHLIMAGNPTRSDGPLYRAATTDRKLWHLVHITSDPEDPKRTPRVPVEWARQEIERWGRDNPWTMTNILGQFPPTASDKLIGVNDVMGAQERDAKPMAFQDDAIIWGLDPARYGDDAAALCRRQGIVCFRFNQWRNCDGPELAAAVATMVLESQAAGKEPDAIFVDVGGVGASAYDHLKLLGWSHLVHAVDFGGAPADLRFANKRAEMWFGMSLWLKRKPSCLPTDPGLVRQLTSPTMRYAVIRKKTCLVLESKEDLRKRGVESPDQADALALTFAEPVAPKSKRITLELAGGRHSARTSYDPFARPSGPGRAATHYDPFNDPLQQR